MQRRQDLPPPGFASNAADGRPHIYFPSSNMDPTQNHPSTPSQTPSVIDLTTNHDHVDCMTTLGDLVLLDYDS